jgi:hypothetical protein
MIEPPKKATVSASAGRGWRGDGGAHVGLGGGEHAEKAGERRGQAPTIKAMCRVPVPRGDVEPTSKHGRKHGRASVLAAHEDHGAEVDLVADVLDRTVAMVVADEHVIDDEGDDETDAAKERGIEKVVKQHDC